MNYYLMMFFSFVFFIVNSSAIAETKIAPWSEKVFEQLEKDYGHAGMERMKKVYNIIQDNQDKTLDEKLKLANDTLNKLPWIADKKKWNQDDYWATPLETITTFGGDCEDMALGKLAMLRLMGVPKKNLYLGYVKLKKTGEIHMVLVWANEQRTDTRVLDNIVKVIKTGKQRTDLIGVYLTDLDGNMIVLNDDGKKRSIKGTVDGKKFKKLEEIKKRSRANTIKYTKINGGKPLYIN
ncbi:MAG: transglutaminase-like cysteine peptidase [gamma proteobacterium symbiont of Taylorina sp.]|nr:transglutaminase-like cysteine peptidase [gamma proteobacterium symbiont of Taylorina sp.]